MKLAALSQRFFGVTPLRLVLGLAVLGAIVGGLIFYDRMGGNEDSELGPLDTRSPVVGEAAPLFALRDQGGDVVKLSDFEGQPVWLNFWATWCGPCRRELPDIQALAEEFQEDGLVVLEINMGESANAAISFWEELDLDLPILLDSNEDVARQYKRFGAPNSFFIDSEGVLRASRLGFITEGQMRELLAEIGVG